MKTYHFTAILFTALIGFSPNAFSGRTYLPPERIPCMMDHTGKISCKNFDRTILTEDAHNADFTIGKNIIFNFFSAVAYSTPDQKFFTVFYTFRDSQNKIMRLKTVNTNIKPDFLHGRWKNFKNEFYTCQSGYMSCGINEF